MDSHFARLQQELESAIAGVSAADLARGPEGKWSPAQILEHLYLTYMNTNRGIAKCLRTGTALATTATLRQRIGKLLVINLGYIPSGRPAPERAVPRGVPAEEVVQIIFPEIVLLDSGVADLENKFGSTTKILDHPLLGPLNTEGWRKFHLVHGLHHAGQIRERLGTGQRMS